MVGTIALPGSALTQNQANEGFEKFCDDKLSFMLEDSQVCIVGLVQDDARVQVFFSTEASLPGQTIEVLENTSPQEGAKPMPLKGLAENVGRVVMIGGLDYFLPTIYEAKLLDGPQQED